MADAAVTDTHPLLMHVGQRPTLGARAAAHFHAVEDGSAWVYVPMAVVWEITFLARAGRIDLRRSPADFFQELFLNPSYQPLDMTLDQVLEADAARFTRDPFDALIVAAAQVLGLPLITRDGDLAASGAVKVIW